jgi:uncharacterized membrane protein
MEEKNQNHVSETETKTKNQNEKICSILAYLFVGIIWYLLDEELKNNSFVKFHVKQSLVLIIFSTALNIIGSILPIIGWFIIIPIASITVIVLSIIGIINAINHEKKELPLIGHFAKKFTF